MDKKKNTSKYEIYDAPSWYQKNLIEFWIIIGGLIAINLIFIPRAFRQTTIIDPTTAGQLGDFVGGYIGTILALVTVVLIYSTLKDQRISSSIEKFQNKYFELISLHRGNVSEISIGRDSGKKIFVLLIREFRAILEITREISMNLKIHFTNKELFIISYYALFFGVGPNSSRMLRSSLKNYDQKFVDSLERALNDRKIKNKTKSDLSFKFTPFEGHQSRLGHYFRHLFQTVCFVDDTKLDIDKYEYIKTIRAQLTTHEQALLFINCLTPIGSIWWDKGLLLRYRFVQNIPSGFFNKDSEIDLESFFPNDYFEWQERKTSKTESESTQPS